jgi:type I restriction enzyme, R subunit
LVAGEPGEVASPVSAGTKWAKPEEVKLSQVIDILNERFGTDFTQADQLFFDSVVAEAKADEQVRRWAEANPLQGFALAMKSKLRDAVVDRLDKNDRIATRYLNEDDFQNVAFNELVRRIYEGIRKTG